MGWFGHRGRNRQWVVINRIKRANAFIIKDPTMPYERGNHQIFE